LPEVEISVTVRAPETLLFRIRSPLMDWSDSLPWLAFGMLGQTAFFSRFLVQWVASERAGRSYVPMAFWYLSLVGSVILLVYAIHRGEPIFLLGYLPNSVVYVRNLMLIRRSEGDGSASDPARPPGTDGG
jgi:lipid-A-disaccharide synthase-like uncharacterized protein